MNLKERCAKYSAIEDYRGRPLIVFATSTRPGAEARMSGDAVREFIDQIDSISDSNEVDVMVHSTGGDALTAWKLMSMLRERFKKVYVLVPYMAFSAATLFALGADEIIMHPHSSLGPIDPQITVVRPDGMGRRFAYEDVGAFLRFLANEVKISEQVHITAVIEKLFSAIDPVTVGAAKRASELSSSVGERLLLLHMKQIEDKAKARQIAVDLNKSFFAHGDAVSRSRAKELQLSVADEDKKLEQLIWDAFLGIESHMMLRKPFDPIQHFLRDEEGTRSLQPLPPVRLPQNAPEEVVRRVWQQAIDLALKRQVEEPVHVSFSLVQAIVESCRRASQYRTLGKLHVVQQPNGQLGVEVIEEDRGWRTVES